MSREVIPNKGLSGLEVAEIIKNRVGFILDRDGFLSNNRSFGRFSFEVKVTLHFDNFLYPEHVALIKPEAMSKQQLTANPGLAAMEPTIPLPNPSGDDEVSATETVDIIQSPNGARLEHDLPIQVQYRDSSGNQAIKDIKYDGDKPTPESVGNSFKVKDLTEQEAVRLGRGRKR